MEPSPVQHRYVTDFLVRWIKVVRSGLGRWMFPWALVMKGRNDF